MSLTEADKGMAKRTLRQYCTSWDEFRYDEIHSKPYFIGKREKGSAMETLFPVSCSRVFTFEELKSCIVDSGSTSVNLAVYDEDSTVVMYKAELGLKPPIVLEDKNTSIVSDNSNVDMQPPESSKKRKINTEFDSPRSDHSETGTNSDCFQIDLHSPTDSELSVVDHKNSDDSNTCSEDKSEVVCS